MTLESSLLFVQQTQNFVESPKQLNPVLRAYLRVWYDKARQETGEPKRYQYQVKDRDREEYVLAFQWMRLGHWMFVLVLGAYVKCWPDQ